MASFIRRKVSQNRIRNKDGTYDLDLTYITKDIIAMGMPTDKVFESVARNPLTDVANFLKEKHGNSFKVYNLLMEQTYNFLAFANMVETFPTEDHHPPLFRNLEKFSESVDEWLKANEDNVVVVHCKAGKGRTGTMIACYFLYSKRFDTPYEAIEYFNSKRCLDSKGITIPSQKRYIEYFADFLKQKRVYESVKLNMKSIDICLPDNKNISLISFKVFRDISTKYYDSGDTKVTHKIKELSINLDNKVQIKDDVKIAFYGKSFGRGKEYLFHVVLNTFCLLQDNIYKKNDMNSLGEIIEKNGLVTWILSKKDIDNACKDKRFSNDLKLTFNFELSNGSSLQSSISQIPSRRSEEVLSISTEYKQVSSIMRSQSIEIPISIIDESKNNAECENKENESQNKAKKSKIIELFKRNSLFTASKKPNKSTRESLDKKRAEDSNKNYEILSNSSSNHALNQSNVNKQESCESSFSSSLQDVTHKSNFSKLFSRNKQNHQKI